MPSLSHLARAGLALLALAGSVAADNKLTSTPANFQGFYILDNGAVSTVSCASGATFFTSSTYGACCTSDNCNFGTACSGGTVTRIFGGTYECTNSGYPNCYSMTVYGSYPSADQSWLIRGCAGTAFKMSTIFREIITATSTKSSSKTASQASTPTNSGPAVTGPADNADNEDGSAGQVTAPPTGLPAATGTPQASTEGGSKAWIAGAVIGPIIGLALIGLVAFWLGRRRKAANENHNIAVAGDAKTDPSVADQSSMHPSVYYGAGSPGMGSPGSPPIGGKYYQGEPPSGINSTPSPVNGYQPMYQQQPAAYGGAGYPPPQQGHYPPQHSPQPSSYSPQPYPAQFAVPPPPLDRYQSPHNAAELPSAPMRDAPQELGDGAPVRR